MVVWSKAEPWTPEKKLGKVTSPGPRPHIFSGLSAKSDNYERDFRTFLKRRQAKMSRKSRTGFLVWFVLFTKVASLVNSPSISLSSKVPLAVRGAAFRDQADSGNNLLLMFTLMASDQLYDAHFFCSTMTTQMLRPHLSYFAMENQNGTKRSVLQVGLIFL